MQRLYDAVIRELKQARSGASPGGRASAPEMREVSA